VERHAFLAAIEHEESGALPVNHGRKAPRVLAAGLFDLDHFGAGFGEHQRRQWARQQRGEIDNKKAGQRLHEFTRTKAPAAYESLPSTEPLFELSVGKAGEDEPQIRQRKIENV